MADRLQEIRQNLRRDYAASPGYGKRSDTRRYIAAFVDVDWLLAEVERLRAARDVDRLGYTVVLLDHNGEPMAVGPAVHSTRGVADERADEDAENGHRCLVAEVLQAEEATP